MTDLFGLTRPLLHLMDPEAAHRLAIRSLKAGLVPRPAPVDEPVLASTLWGLAFPNPVGLAAGFDKNAEVPDAMLDQGFGFVEVGSVTPLAQPGNPAPRLFRLTPDRAVINRMGFTNDGAEAVAQRLAARPRRGVVGVNLGKNKITKDAVDDYVLGVRALAPHADYVVVNVSSPNTPGLRALQGREPLAALLAAVKAELAATLPEATPPLLLKIAPDLTDEDKADIAAVALAEGIDGLIATNTTITRPDSLADGQKRETGGLSGRPLKAMAQAVLTDLYRLTEGRLPLIGVGGIEDGADAYARIRAGASLVQVYSAMVFDGPGLARRINLDLAARLKADGFDGVTAAVGVDA
ncbi:MAG: quinone-dependent dihydroorotate dehydrogenase [Rhodobacterales bacterium]|nr:quinone-dependent dihydroorotate dehydrogenase [Rhodobacterales bacterium]